MEENFVPKFLKLKQVQSPNNINFKYECIDKNSAAGCIIFNNDYTKVLLVKQFRAGSESNLLEIPAGIVETNETPDDCIFREIREEVGYDKDDLEDFKFLNSYYSSPGYSSEKIYLYCVRLKSTAKLKPQKLDDEEKINFKWYDVNDDFYINDMKTQLAYLMFKNTVKKKKIGVFGGTFNPITNLHLMTVERAIEELKLDKVLIVPVNDKYIKGNMIISNYRTDMINLAIQNNSKVELGNYEVEQFLQPQTIETLTYYQSKYGYADIYFICGSDLLKQLHNWAQEELILEKFNIICIQRDNDAVYQDIILKNEKLLKYKDKIHIIYENVINNISASSVRNLIKSNMSIRYMVPDNVRQYIIDNGLYKEGK